MSSANEESPANNPIDALYALSRRPAEPPRLAAVGDNSPFPRVLRPEPLRPLTAPGEQLEAAMSDFVRRQLQPQVVPEPNDLRRDGSRRTLMASIIGVLAAVAVASIVALVFITIYPKKDAEQSFAAASMAAAPLSRQADDSSKSALSQFRGVVAPDGGGQGFTHEQSERLLQQFVQWRQKADKP
jgi:hypothetical protein